MNRKEQELDVEQLNQELKQELQELSDESQETTAGQSHHRHHESRGHRADSGRQKSRKKAKKKWSPFQICITILCVLVCILLLVVGVFLFLKIQGEKELSTGKNETEITAPDDAELEDEGKYIIYKGEKYCYNEDVISILCMGIDKSIQETGEDNIGANGQADALVLIVLDSKDGTLSLVNISRDSMVDVNKYNVNGQYLGTEKMQICLAYAYGDGKEKSCLNTVESVSRLMYGMPIHAYAAIDYDGIGVLNDAVGGVTVQVLEDMTYVDPAFKEGNTVMLEGEQAHSYVRTRNVDLLESNNLRMARQKQYMMAFLQKALAQTRSDINVPLTLYQAAGDYMVTNISYAEVTYLASRIVDTGISDGTVTSVPGEVVRGETYAEFIPDEEGLYELILNVFYKKVNE